MNPAARTAFARPLEEFSKSLPSRVIQRLAQCAEAAAGGVLAIKIGRGPALRCSVEMLNLAGGERGLIVAVTADGEELAPAPPPPSMKKAAPKKDARKARAAPAKARAAKPMRPPTLTDDEMRAFKAIGRKVRRLCEEKRRAGEEDAALAPMRPSVAAPPRTGDAGQTLKNLQSAFDLVLLLGDGLEIVRVEGRPRMGWRKPDLKGKPLTELLPPPDRAAFQRMLKKLRSGARSARETLCVLDGKGDGAPCRAVLGRHEAGGVAYFFAALSLELPARLRPRAPDPAIPAPRRLAA